MNAKNINIKGYGDLDTILRHYNNIQLLIDYIKWQPDGWKVLSKWDDARTKPFTKDIELVIE